MKLPALEAPRLAFDPMNIGIAVVADRTVEALGPTGVIAVALAVIALVLAAHLRSIQARLDTIEDCVVKPKRVSKRKPPQTRKPQVGIKRNVKKKARQSGRPRR